MTALTFDTHAVVKSIKDAGANESLAESIVSAIQAGMGHLADLATKADLKNFPTKADLKADLESFATKADLKADLKNFATKADLKAELENFATKTALKEGLENCATKADLKDLEDRMTARMTILEQRMTIRLGVMIVAAVGLATAVARLL